VRADRPDLRFDAQRREIASTEEWQQLVADQPWTASRRRQLVLKFLQAKLEAPGEQLQLEGAAGMWEMSINKEHHLDLLSKEASRAVVERVASPNIEVARMCAAAVWGLAVSEEARHLLQELGVVEVLVEAARRSLTLECCADTAGVPLDQYTGQQRPTFSQRQHFQAAVLGALSVLLVDRACRVPFIQLEPACATLFQLW